MTPEQTGLLREQLNNLPNEQRWPQNAPSFPMSRLERTSSAPTESQPMQPSTSRRKPLTDARASDHRCLQEVETPSARSRRHRAAFIASSPSSAPPTLQLQNSGQASPDSTDTDQMQRKYGLYRDAVKKLRRDLEVRTADARSLTETLNQCQSELRTARLELDGLRPVRVELDRLRDDLVTQMEDNESLARQLQNTNERLVLLEQEAETSRGTHLTRDQDLHALLNNRDALAQRLRCDSAVFQKEFHLLLLQQSDHQQQLGQHAEQLQQVIRERDQLAAQLEEQKEGFCSEQRSQDFQKQLSAANDDAAEKQNTVPFQPRTSPQPETQLHDEEVQVNFISPFVCSEVQKDPDDSSAQLREETKEWEQKLKYERAEMGQREQEYQATIEKVKFQNDTLAHRIEELHRQLREAHTRQSSQPAEDKSLKVDSPQDRCHHIPGMVSHEAFEEVQEERTALRDRLAAIQQTLEDTKRINETLTAEAVQNKSLIAQLKTQSAYVPSSHQDNATQQTSNPSDRSPLAVYQQATPVSMDRVSADHSGKPSREASSAAFEHVSHSEPTAEVKQLRFSLTQAHHQIQDLKINLVEQQNSAKRAIVSVQAEVAEAQNRAMRSEAHAAQIRSSGQARETELKFQLEQAEHRLGGLRKELECVRAELSFKAMQTHGEQTIVCYSALPTAKSRLLSATESTLRKTAVIVMEQRKIIQRLEAESSIVHPDIRILDLPVEAEKAVKVTDAKASVESELALHPKQCAMRYKLAAEKALQICSALAQLDKRFQKHLARRQTTISSGSITPALGTADPIQYQSLKEGLAGIATSLQVQLQSVDAIVAEASNSISIQEREKVDVEVSTKSSSKIKNKKR